MRCRTITDNPTWRSDEEGWKKIGIDTFSLLSSLKSIAKDSYYLTEYIGRLLNYLSAHFKIETSEVDIQIEKLENELQILKQKREEEKGHE